MISPADIGSKISHQKAGGLATRRLFILKYLSSA
jgi:hypothetical protein